MAKQPDYDVTTPIDTNTDKTKWHRIGAAWMKDSKSISIQLDSLPLNGKLFLFPHEEKAEKNGDGNSSASAAPDELM